jgi:hypothetical protein
MGSVMVLKILLIRGSLVRAQEEEQHNPLSAWYSLGYLFLGRFLSHILSQKFQQKTQKLHPSIDFKIVFFFEG